MSKNQGVGTTLSPAPEEPALRQGGQDAMASMLAGKVYWPPGSEKAFAGSGKQHPFAPDVETLRGTSDERRERHWLPPNSEQHKP